MSIRVVVAIGRGGAHGFAEADFARVVSARQGVPVRGGLLDGGAAAGLHQPRDGFLSASDEVLAVREDDARGVAVPRRSRRAGWCEVGNGPFFGGGLTRVR